MERQHIGAHVEPGGYVEQGSVGVEGRVSVLIVNWNGRKYLQRCLDSLAAQAYRDVEVVLVDNGSTDGSVAYVRESYPEVVLAPSKRNLGFSEGNNEAARHASGEYIFMLNNDAWVQDDTIDRLMTTARSMEKPGIIGCRVLNPDGSIQDVGLKIDALGFPRGVTPPSAPVPSRIDDLFYVSACALFMRQCVFQELGGFDQRYVIFHDEVDLAWRARLRGYSVVTDMDAVVYHVGGGTMTGGAPGKEQNYRTTTRRVYLRERNTLTTLLKNYSARSLLRVLPLYMAINVAEMLFFLLLLQPKVSQQYVRSYWWNVTQLPSTLRDRQHIQRRRRVSDRDIARYFWPNVQKLSYLNQNGLPRFDS